ncbi:MAG: KEOPS complex subunit Pcc1 [Thermoplasmata archaeon]|nr:KEOPS complex subunit Pcc1 [Thermoplasmata archaeon]
MTNSAEIIIDSKNAEILYKALRVEGERNIPRTSIKIENMENKLKIFINASDVNAMRAAINSYMRWINLSMKLLEMV